MNPPAHAGGFGPHRPDFWPRRCRLENRSRSAPQASGKQNLNARISHLAKSERLPGKTLAQPPAPIVSARARTSLVVKSRKGRRSEGQRVHRFTQITRIRQKTQPQKDTRRDSPHLCLCFLCFFLTVSVLCNMRICGHYRLRFTARTNTVSRSDNRGPSEIA